jgi:hypothetical protein
MKLVTVPWVVGIAILFPIFFQLSGDIYNSVEAVFDSGGVLNTLPLPLSIIACFVGTLALKNNFRRASLALKIAGAMFLAMLVSLLLAGEIFPIEKRKIILMAQILLPVAGLVLGMVLVDDKRAVPKAFLGVLLLLVPAQLVASWIQGGFMLTHYLYGFSVYQHFQYVPLIFVGAFIFAIANLWSSHRKYFYLLAPLMGIYVVASFSLLTMFAFFTFLVVFALTRLRAKDGQIDVMMITGVALICMLTYFSFMKEGVQNYRQYYGKFQMIEKGEKPKNLTDRLADWKLYGNGIIESTRTVLVGHPAPFPREVKSSAHNWYLDIAYNFGVISWLPTFALLFYTGLLLWQNRVTLPTEILWLAVIVFYLVVVDSNFKVTLRQPYPGIFAYFMWGILLAKLLAMRDERTYGKAI